jgi:hypothetical protein
MEKVFSKYLRDEKGQPFGFVAVDQFGCFGFSLCCPRDRFNKKLARQIALGRLAKNRKAPQIKHPMRGPKEAAAFRAVTDLRVSVADWLARQPSEREGEKGGAMK